MAEPSKGSLSSPSGATPTGNGVTGGGDSRFHSQQMHQQFSYSGKFQPPLGVHQQRPVMVSYDQHSVSHQQGPYAHHAPYQQLLQNQQHLQVQYQQQHMQQQQHQQQQMQFIQQSENVQHSMQYNQDARKSTESEPKQKLELLDPETQDREPSSRITATEKTDTNIGAASTKEVNLTPEQRDLVAKEIEAVRAAHEKQVKELEERIKSLEEKSSQKEVKYLRVSSSDHKKKKLKKNHQSINLLGNSTVDESHETEMDTNEGTNEVYSTRSSGQKKKDMKSYEEPEEDDVFDSCPSPANSVHSDISIKQEEFDDDDIPPALTAYEKKKAIKAVKENSKSDAENIPSKSYTVSVTDFEFCIYCQTKSEKKMLDVTEDILETIQSIVLNVDCEESQRLKDYILDTDMFFDNLPQYHSYCQNKLRDRLLFFRKKKKTLDETNISLCVICQENKIELLNNCTNNWFAVILCALNKMDDEQIENLKKFFNFDRFKKVVEGESANDQQISTDKFKFHKKCRFKFIVRNRPKKKLKTLTPEDENIDDNVEISEPKNKENNLEITADEEIFELLAKRKKLFEKKKQKKLRKVLPEPNEFDYTKCVICGIRSKGSHFKTKQELKSMSNTIIQKTRNNAEKNQHSDIIKILEHGVNFDINLLFHGTCSKTYNYNRPVRVKKGTMEYMDRAFEAVLTEIEDLMFRSGKVLSLVELREKYLKNLMELKVDRECKMGVFVIKIKKYYTFKKCRVNIIPYPDYLIYSNHLSESQVAPQINILKKCKEDETYENSSNKDSENSEIKHKWRFLCTECGYKCQKKSSLKNHMKKHELRSVEEIVLSKQIMCDVCGKMLGNKKSLQAHLLTHSDKKEKYSCSQCNRTYLSKYALNTHELTHTGEKNVECPFCEKKFLVKKYIYRHIRLVHETKTEAELFLCSVCGQGFKTKQALHEHSRKHSDARPFVCKDCGKSFKFRSPWRTHMLAHEGKKPQMCSICSFGCYTKANLKIHMVIHTERREEEICSNSEKVNEKSVLENYINLNELPNIKTQMDFTL